MRRIFLVLFISFISGIVVWQENNLVLGSAVFTALFLIVMIMGKKKIALFSLIFFLLGIFNSFIHSNNFDNKYLQIKNSKRLEGFIIEKGSNNFIIKNYKKGYKIFAFADSSLKGEVGDYINFACEVRENPEYKKKSLYGRAFNANVKIDKEDYSIEKRKSFFMIPYRTKFKINDAILSIDPIGGSFVAGLLSGYDDEMSYDKKSEFDELGIAHILAVSGFNLGIIYLFLMKLTTKFYAKTRYLIAFGLCFFYSLLTGFEPSVFRAFVMISIMLLAKLINRSYDPVHGITLSAFIMLVANSYYLNNVGFLLSYSATYGILLFERKIEEFVPERLSKFKAEISVGVAAFISTLPIVVCYRGYISLTSIVVNVIIGPFIAIMTIVGFGASMIFIALGVKAMLYPVVFLGRFFLWFIGLVSNFNLQIFPGEQSLIFIFAYYLLVLILFGYISLRVVKFHKKVVCGVLSVIILFSMIYKDSVLKVHFLNVGQGDSIFIETPDRKAILIDTGPEYKDYISARDKVLPYIKRCGYNKIDVLVITHFHMDHSGGVKFLLENFKVGKVIAFENPEGENMIDSLVRSGDKITLGNVNLDILFPNEIQTDTNDKNETCIVLNLNYKDFSALLTSDAEAEVLDGISGDFDIFKVSHHGSAASFSERMLENSNIGTAVISVGKNNFGHPSDKVIDFLIQKGIEVHRTDREGDVTIITSGEGYRVSTQ